MDRFEDHDRLIRIFQPITYQYSNPVRVVSFNTAEGWSRDVSEDIADALRRQCELAAREPPGNIKEFIERFEVDRSQLRLHFA